MDFVKDLPGAVAAALSVLAVGVIVWCAALGGDAVGLLAFVARLVHVAAAMIWIGAIWFVNFVQHRALAEADEAGRLTLMRLIAPRVALGFRMAAHTVLASGVVLLGTSGYMFDRMVFSSTVYIPMLRGSLMLLGALAGIAMWALVTFVIWPNLRIVIESAGRVPVDARVRQRVRAAAQINFGLGVVATCAMVGAAHLY